MIGVLTDPVFGPAITFGTGGTAVEVYADRAVGTAAAQQLPRRRDDPLDARRQAARARFAACRRRIWAAIENALLRVSEMVCELPWIREMDINPLRRRRARRHRGRRARRASRRGRLRRGRTSTWRSIRIPRTWCREWRAPDGDRRHDTPDHVPRTRRSSASSCTTLSPQAKYLRFMGSLKDLTPGDAGAVHPGRLRPRDGADRPSSKRRRPRRADRRRALRHQSRRRHRASSRWSIAEAGRAAGSARISC